MAPRSATATKNAPNYNDYADASDDELNSDPIQPPTQSPQAARKEDMPSRGRGEKRGGAKAGARTATKRISGVGAVSKPSAGATKRGRRPLQDVTNSAEEGAAKAKTTKLGAKSKAVKVESNHVDQMADEILADEHVEQSIEGDEFAPAMEPVQTVMAEAAVPKKRGVRTKKNETAQTASVQDAEITENVDGSKAPTKAGAGKRTRPAQITQANDDPISNTAPDVMDLDGLPLQSVRPHAPLHTAHIPRNGSVQRWARAGSASSMDRGGQGDTTGLRRRLNDMTKNFQALKVKYNDMEEVGIKEAEESVEKMTQQLNERAKAADDLIASLRAELASARDQAKRVSEVQSQRDILQKEKMQLEKDKKQLQTELTTAHAEIRTLSAKLSAQKSASVNGAMNVPGSAVKANVGSAGRNNGINAKGNDHEEFQKARLKEEMYSDLTGLIIRDVKRREEDGAEVYDCIQTGRNGTLRFWLTLAPDAPGVPYHDVEFEYLPLLDESNDRQLIAILPEYLTEEICFPRNNAAKFYSRIQDCLTKRVEIVEDDAE